jgi:ABC-type Na+ transport system ATPase subunit NatA
VTWTIEGNKTLLDNISISARPGTLTAIIGPSGAGKSTFARLVAGYTHPTTGTVSFEGHDIHAEYASLRSRIGMVPQDDVVHGQLTVNQALMYAAELRLPPDTTKEDRRQVVAQVLEELEMTRHADTRVDKLSGGQRKRASVALELLTGPSLLILDEPTSGLDLRRPAGDDDAAASRCSRVALWSSHTRRPTSTCDQALLLAPAARRLLAAQPNGPSMGTTNWADFAAGWPATRRGPQGFSPSTARRLATAGAKPADLGQPIRTSARAGTDIARRNAADRVRCGSYFSWRCCRSSWVCCRCRCPETSASACPFRDTGRRGA